MKAKIFITFLIFISAFQACKEVEAKENVQLISVEEMKDQLRLDDVQVIDVRSQTDFSEAHIIKAKNLVYDDKFAEKIANLDKSKPVIVYCTTGHTSAEAVKLLKEHGFKKIYDLEGGLEKWVLEGEELEE